MTILDREDLRLVAALRAYAKRERPDFPFDDMAFTLEMAADKIEKRASFAEQMLSAGSKP